MKKIERTKYDADTMCWYDLCKIEEYNQIRSLHCQLFNQVKKINKALKRKEMA